MRHHILLSTALFCLAAGAAFGACTASSPYACTGGSITVAANPNQTGTLGYNSQTVSGLTGSISTVSVTLNNWTDSNGDTDREFMLVFQPTGCNSTSCEQTFQFAGGVGLGSNGPGISNLTVTFEDGATNYAPGVYDGDPTNNANYKPTVNNVETTCSGDGNGATFGGGAPFASAPCATYNKNDSNDGPSDGTATFGSQFSGNPNGTWTLYVWTNQFAEDNSASIGGWTLTIATQSNAANTTTTLSSNATNNETNESTSVTLTATVSSTSTVNEGTVEFTDNGNMISGCGSVAVSGGTAHCTTSFSTEGNHPLEAAYSGGTDFGSSHGTLNFFVDHPTSNPSPGVYCNTGTITINTNTSPGTTPYPQHVFVTSQTGTLSDVSLTLPNITTDASGAISDYNFLLVGPNGNKFIPLAGSGGQSAASGVTLTLSDFGGSAVPNPVGSASSGTYQPTDDNAGLSFPSGTPSGPYQLPQNQGGATFDTTFGGGTPNGQWSLYVYDTSGQQTGSIAGYCLSITTSSAVATTTTVTSSPSGEATVGENVTFTATVKQSSNNAVVPGSVTFKENGTTLSGPTTLDGNGQATFQTSSLAEGIHTITANYGGVTGTDNVSSGTVTIEIDTATTNPSAGVYCNPGGVNISGSNSGQNIPASPYPSRVNVTNLAGTVNTVGVSLNNFSDNENDATVMLLEGPTSTNIVFWNDIGNDTNSSNDLNLTISDAAGSGNPIPASPSNNGTYYPTSNTALSTAVFPTPAPSSLSFAPPEGSQIFTRAFQNINGNGYWSLFMYNRFGSEALAVGKWCLNVVTNPPVVTLKKVHNGTFTQGDSADTYTITVANPSGPGSTAGTMTLTDTLPTGMSAVSMAQTGGGTGSDWTCSASTVSCTRTSAMAPGESDTITLTVSVSYNAPTTTNAAVNNVSLSGGGISGSPVTAQDTQTVQVGPGYALNLSVNPSGAGTATANPTNSAGLTAGHYVPGATVTLTATPTQTSTTGYAFASWSGSADLTSTSQNPTTITMNSATESVTANFQIVYTQVSSGISVSSNGLLYNKIKKQGTETLTIRNTSGQTISGPIQLMLSGMPAGVTAANNTGSFTGNPYWTVTAGSLAPGASAQVTVILNYASGTNFSTGTTVYSGNLQ